VQAGTSHAIVFDPVRNRGVLSGGNPTPPGSEFIACHFTTVAFGVSPAAESGETSVPPSPSFESPPPDVIEYARKHMEEEAEHKRKFGNVQPVITIVH
jgi:hypothetical protein